jgi:hypothetical protein
MHTRTNLGHIKSLLQQRRPEAREARVRAGEHSAGERQRPVRSRNACIITCTSQREHQTHQNRTSNTAKCATAARQPDSVTGIGVCVCTVSIQLTHAHNGDCDVYLFYCGFISALGAVGAITQTPVSTARNAPRL